MKTKKLLSDLQSVMDNKHIKLNEPMSNHTSFKTGGCVDILIEPNTTSQFRDILKTLHNYNAPYNVFGKMSNVLISDSGIRGVVIKIADNFSNIIIDNTHLITQAGTTLRRLVNFGHINGLCGIESLAGIPGTVGGAVVMNAGAYGGEVKDHLISIEVIDENLDIIEMNASELDLSYRHSIFNTQKKYITKAVFKLETSDIGKAREYLSELNEKRKSKQPLNYPSAGSTFKRPVGYYAAKLIEDCDLKGYSIGGAEVSELHSGFIINKDNATSKDIYHLIRNVQERVYLREGVKLEPEVKMFGKFK